MRTTCAMKVFLVNILLAFSIVVKAQTTERLFDRLQGYKEEGNYYFNTDGVRIAGYEP